MKKLAFCMAIGMWASLFWLDRGVCAATVYGKVTFVGTYSEFVENNNYHSQFRFRVSQSTCGNDTAPKERWIHVKSGRMDGKFIHNMANFRNAYSTVLSAFLAGKGVQVDAVPSCDASKVQTINLWNAWIGMIP